MYILHWIIFRIRSLIWWGYLMQMEEKRPVWRVWEARIEKIEKEVGLDKLGIKK